MTERAPFATLPQWWRERCHEWAGQLALRHKRRGIWSGVSWQSYFEFARAVGLALDDTGLQPGEVVGILSENRPEWLYTDLGAQSMGFVVQGIDPSSSPALIEQPLNASGARVVVVGDAEQLGKVLQLCGNCPSLRRIVVIEPRGLRGCSDHRVVLYQDFAARGLALAAQKGHALRFEQSIDAGDGEQTALLQTMPGPSFVAQRELMFRIRVAPQWLTHQPDERALSIMPLAYFDEHVLTSGAPLVDGCVVHFPESADTVPNDLREVAPQRVLGPRRLWQLLHDQTESFMLEATPIARSVYRWAMTADVAKGWRRLALRNVRESIGLHATRAAAVGGEPVSDDLTRWYASIGVPLAAASPRSASSVGDTHELPELHAFS